MSSDGGVLLLRGIEKRLGLAARLGSCLTDTRDPASTTHSYADMIGARMGLSMIDLFGESFERVPDRIVLDIDDAVHGGQQLALFNAHYGEYCFQPIHIFEASTAKPVLSLLRPGKRPSREEAARILKHVIRRIRRHWPRVGTVVRGDGHYGAPEVMDLLEDLGCGYVFGLPGNTRLTRIGQPWCEDVAVRRVRSRKHQVRRFFQTGYQAGSWSRERTVIARVEATSKGSDIRFIVTNLPCRSKVLYERIYCARGRMENMIKEHKLYTKSDRTSCHRWEANQFRLFLHSGAYWLLHQLRQAAPRRSPWRKATFETIRRAFLKIAVRIEELKSRVRVALPSVYPYRPALVSMAGCIAAQGP